MKRFLLGVALGALGAYVAAKLADKDTREEWCEELDKKASDAKLTIEERLKSGRGKALRAGVKVREEYREGKRKINETAGDIAGKLAENLAEFETKAKERANN